MNLILRHVKVAGAAGTCEYIYSAVGGLFCFARHDLEFGLYRERRRWKWVDTPY